MIISLVVTILIDFLSNNIQTYYKTSVPLYETIRQPILNIRQIFSYSFIYLFVRLCMYTSNISVLNSTGLRVNRLHLSQVCVKKHIVVTHAEYFL